MSGTPLNPSRRSLALCFTLFLLLTLAWQAVYVALSTRGDPAGLFYAGSRMPLPPELRGSFQYPNSHGYDGQEYRILAHDPLDRKQSWKYLDDPRYRSRRILLPALAALLAAGQPKLVDLSFILITDLILACGAVCFVRLAHGVASPAVLLAIYSLIPAVAASTDRMVIDGPAVAGFLAALLWFRERRWGACLVLLVLLPLLRETAILVTAGIGIAFFMRRDYARTAWAAATTLPALAWFVFSGSRTPPSTTLRVLSVPLWPHIARLFRTFPRPVSPTLNLAFQFLDLLGCVCLLVAFFWCGRAVYTEFRQRAWKEDTLIVLPSAALAAIASGPEIMSEAYAFLRVDSVLLAWVLLRMMRRSPRLGAGYAAACSLPFLVYRAGPFLKALAR